MNQKRIAVITGATSGLGFEVAGLLAQEGWHLALLSRSIESGTRTLESLKAQVPTFEGNVFAADLSNQRALVEAATEIAARYPSIDALLNVAGVLLGEILKSPQGYEMHFQINTLAPYILMRKLHPALAASGQATVLNVSSGSMFQTGRLKVDELKSPPTLRKLFGAYAQSKLALTTLTNAMAADYEKSGIVLRSMDPGPNKTAMTAGAGMPKPLLWLRPLLFKSPQKGAQEIVEAAFSPKFERRTALYIAGGKEKKPPSDVNHQDIQCQLLSLCAEATHL